MNPTQCDYAGCARTYAYSEAIDSRSRLQLCEQHMHAFRTNHGRYDAFRKARGDTARRIVARFLREGLTP